MVSDNQKAYFDDVESVITHPLIFKAKLSIGEDAYTSLRMKNKVLEAWDTVGVACTAVGLAQSTAIAGTFFAPTGMLSLIGLGAAVTPIGWVVGAGVVAGGAWVGISKFLKNSSTSRVTVVPNFINTPMDILALGLFDLIVPLALKVANVDGHIDDLERNHIEVYFVREWGYDKTFVHEGVACIESNLGDYSIEKLAQDLSEFKKGNPDCNYEPMCKEIIKLLTNVMEVDGRIDEREEASIDLVSNIFKETDEVQLTKVVKNCWVSVKGGVSKVLNNSIIPNK